MIAKWIAWSCGIFFLLDGRPGVLLTALGLWFLASGCNAPPDTSYRALSTKNAIIIGDGDEQFSSVADSILGHLLPAWQADRRLLKEAGLGNDRDWLAGLQYLPREGWLPTFVSPWRNRQSLDQYYGEQSWKRFSTFKGVPVFQWRKELFAADAGGFLIAGRLPLLVEDAIREIEGGSANLGADRVFRRQWSRYSGTGRRLFLRLSEFPDTGSGRAPWLNEYEWLDLYLEEEEGRWSIEGEAQSKRQRIVEPFAQGREPSWSLPFLPENITLLRWTHNSVSELPEPYAAYFGRWWNGGITVFRYEGQPLPVIVFHSTAVERTTADLDKLADRQGVLDSEPYQLFQIRRILDEQLLEPWAPMASRNPYFAVIGDYAVFSASRAALTVCIDYFTAGRPPAFPPSLLQVSDPSANGLQWFRPDLFFESGWPPIEVAWSERPADGHLYLQGGGRGVAPDREGASLWWKYPLENDIVAGPAAVRNTAGNLLALLVQDAGDNLYCLDAEGDLQWRRSVAGKIESDFLILNGQAGTRIFFNTSNKIYGLDVQGALLDHFPIELPVRAAAGLQVVDFDRTGQASLFVPTIDAAVYGFDQTGSLLPGWNPLRDTLSLRFPLIHLQENYQDLLLGVNTADRILCWNRAGEAVLPGRQLDTLCLSPPQLLRQPSPQILWVEASGRGSVLSGSGGWTSFSLPGGGNQWFLADLGGDERVEWLSLHGRLVAAYTKSGSKFRKLFQYEFDHPQDTIFILAESQASAALFAALDRQRKQLRVLNHDGHLVTRSFLAADRPAVLVVRAADHFALATGLGKDVVVYGVDY